MHKTALLAYVDAAVTEEADDAAALSHTERETREAEVMSDLLAVERDEKYKACCGSLWPPGRVC